MGAFQRGCTHFLTYDSIFCPCAAPYFRLTVRFSPNNPLYLGLYLFIPPLFRVQTPIHSPQTYSQFYEKIQTSLVRIVRSFPQYDGHVLFGHVPLSDTRAASFGRAYSAHRQSFYPSAIEFIFSQSVRAAILCRRRLADDRSIS